MDKRAAAAKPASTKIGRGKKPVRYLGSTGVTLKYAPKSRVSSICVCIVACIATLLGIVLFTGVSVLLFYSQKLLVVQCPSRYDRTCNDHGTCVNGVCVCDALFSGQACTDTQIPGYDLKTDSMCNRNGFVVPFIDVPSVCEGNWAGVECAQFVKGVQTDFTSNGFDARRTRFIQNIPICTCNIGFGGLLCNRAQCPVDENGYICAGNGNTTVGLLRNATATGNGCQCANVFTFYQNATASLFTPAQLVEFITEYNEQYNTQYCGEVFNPVPGVVVAYSTEANYRCYCQEDWYGYACTEGKCPQNTASKEICYGNGSPYLGLGILTNTTLSARGSQKCTLNCADGYTSCQAHRCMKDIGTSEYPLFKRGQYCNSPQVCPSERPLRCQDGTCARIPTEESGPNQCYLGYWFGSIDLGQLQRSVDLFKCQNLTTALAFTDCFLNTSVADGVVGFLERQGGAVVESSLYTLTLNFTSPLVYFEFVTNTSFVTVQTWDGQAYTSEEGGYVSHIFTYPSLGEWTDSVQWSLLVEPKANGTYYISPMPWNYSGAFLYPSEFAEMRLILTENEEVSPVFSSAGSFIRPMGPAFFDNGLFVILYIPTEYEDSQYMYYRPSDNTSITQENCFDSPSACAWYYDPETDQVRSPSSAYWICASSVPDIPNPNVLIYPVVQASPCEANYTDYAARMGAFVIGWETVLVSVLSGGTVDTTQSSFYTFYQLRGTGRALWPVTISWYNGSYILIQNPAFLTLDRGINFPCACSPITLVLNQSVYDREFFETGIMRTVNFGLSNQQINGQFAVGRRYVNGRYEYFRGQITAHQSSSNVLRITNERTNETASFFYTDARILTRSEYLGGSYDCDLFATPFRCPDGACSTATAFAVDQDVSCNCTYTAPIANCSCIDPLLDRWGCQCNMTTPQCQCGYPTLPDFENELVSEMQTLLGLECDCLFFMPDSDALNSDGTLISENTTFPNSTFAEFTFNYSQVIEFLAVLTDSEPVVYATSYLFSNVTNLISYEFSLGDDGEYWIRLNLNPDIAYDTLYVESSTTIERLRVLFAVDGFPITASLAEQNTTFRASSNEANASFIAFPDDTYWYPSEDARDYPVWIELSYPQRYFVDFTSATFILTGRFVGDPGFNYTLPVRIYVEATNDDRDADDWFTLGSWGVFANETGRVTRTLSFANLTSETYSRFRLVSYGAFFGVQHWDMYTKQTCRCASGRVTPVINVTSYAGLPTIQEQLDLIDFYYANTASSGGCVCSETCFVYGANVSANGVCNDAVYQGDLIGLGRDVQTVNVTSLSFEGAYSEMNITLLTEYDLYLVQFTNEPGTYYQFSADDLAPWTFFYNSTVSGSPFQTLVSDPQTNPYEYGAESILNTTSLYVFYANATTLEVLSNTTADTPSSPIQFWLASSYNFSVVNREYVYAELIRQGRACFPGQDCADCGPSSRSPTLMSGFGCSLSAYQSSLLTHIQDTNLVYNRTYFLQNLFQLTLPWTAYFQNVPLQRRVRAVLGDDCPGQVCSNASLPFKCKDGKCVASPKDCDLRYSCPGNGCVRLMGVSTSGEAYRCACAAGYGGDACQFGEAKPATPYLLPTDPGFVPLSQAITCGGVPPFRFKPPVLNIGNALFDTTPATVEQLNSKVRTGCGQRSSRDFGYHCVMPLHAPFGQPVPLKYTYTVSSDFSTLKERTITQYVACARKGYFGQQLLLDDDVAARNARGDVVRWKTWTNPFTGQSEQFPWTNGICTYNDFPYLCPNGQAVENAGLCAQSARLYKPCNGPNRGTCQADGTCLCNPAYRTFAINNEISEYIRYPYYSIGGIPNPTIWELNFNWRHYGQNQCAAKNCLAEDGCQVVLGCFPGTPLLQFKDKYVICPANTGKPNRCAPSISNCLSGQGLTLPLPCYGKGILRYKDITNEPYCICGDPVSPLVNITSVAQETDLRPNGWGGEFCGSYYADTAAPLIWSPWDVQMDRSHRSKVTGDDLPGIWVKGNVIVGPDPNDKRYWDVCCSQYDRLEECDLVPCRMDPNIVCKRPDECLAFSETAPMVKVCNGHGRALADGTCKCDEGYIFDFRQFSVRGCYRLVQCPVSRMSGKKCNAIDQCASPGQWRYPFPLDKYFEQQWYTCGVDGRGEYSNATLLSEISINVYNFQSQLVQSLGDIAISVIDAETSLAGCICVHPGDTAVDHCCMVDNGVQYTYDQNYKAAYKLALTTGDDTLDAILFKERLIGTDIPGNTTYRVQVAPAGPVSETTKHVQVFLPNNATSTVVTALRVYSAVNVSNVVNVKLISSTGDVVCSLEGNPNVPAPLAVTFGQMEWNTPSVGSALQCGPFYRCVKSAELSSASDPCLLSPSSASCFEYRRSSCTANSVFNVYWPLASVSIYTGCDRDADSDAGGCTCCKLLSAYQTVTDGTFNLTFTGNGTADIGNVEVYGYTNESLPMPERFVSDIEAKVGFQTMCRDERFLTDTLEADKSYFVPLNTTGLAVTLTATQASEFCKESGGYLAIPMNAIEPEDLSLLQQTCDLVSSAKGSCIVGLYDTELDKTFTPRSQLFQESCLYCYALVPSQSMRRVVYARDPAYFSVSRFPSQGKNTDVNSYYYSMENCQQDPFGPNIWDPIKSQLRKSRNPCIAVARVRKVPLLNQAIDRTNHVYPIVTVEVVSGVWGMIRFQIVPFMSMTTPGAVYDPEDPKKKFTYRSSYASGNGNTYYIMYGQDINWENAEVDCSYPGYPCLRKMSDGITQINIYPPNARLSLRKKGIGDRYVNFYKGSHAQYECIKRSGYAACGGWNEQYCIVDYDSKWLNWYKINNRFGLVYIGGATPNNECMAGNINSKYSGFTVTPSSDLYGDQVTDFYILYTYLYIPSDPTNQGSALPGGNATLGFKDNDYLPFFSYVRVYSIMMCQYNRFVQVWGDYGGSPSHGFSILTNQFSYADPRTTSADQAKWKSGQYSFYGTGSIFRSVPVQPAACSTCVKNVTGTNLWRQQYYSSSLVWLTQYDNDFFRYPVLLLNSTLQYLVAGTTPVSLPSLETLNPRMYTYQVMQLSPYHDVPSPPINWDFPSCFAVTSTGALPTLCDIEAHAFICQYDWVKYATVTGYQCDECGPSTRIGGTPRANLTCFEDNKLANATAYPFQHVVKQAYLAGSLDIFAAAFNPSPEEINFGNNSVVFGFSDAWVAWKNGFSSREGQLSLNARPDPSWCDMSLTMNFPVNCGIQVNPRTNLAKRYCASDLLYCNLNAEIPDNALLQSEDIPKIFAAIAEANAYLDRSCGENVDLSGYVLPNKYGAPQSGLTEFVQVLSLDPVRIRLNTGDGSSQWYNSGKTNIHSSLNWNDTLTVYGEYVLSPCAVCTDMTLTVFMYPLNPYYLYPTDRLEVNVTLVASGEKESFQVDFYVDAADTGTFDYNGFVFPSVVYKGVGYQFHGNDLINSIVTLYDPVLTTADSRLACTTRQVPPYYGPQFRVESTSPHNLCIYTEEDQAAFPGQDIGTCGCDFAFAGDTCDCPAVTSTKYAERVCGGFGRQGKSALAPDGTLVTTGIGANSGCYHYKGGSVPDCDTTDVGRSLYTLLVPGAIFAYPSVYVNALPVRGVSIYQIVPNELGDASTTQHAFADVEAVCEQNGMAVPFFFAIDELAQLISETIGALPVFVSVDTALSTSDVWPWISNVDGTYFIRETVENAAQFTEYTITLPNTCQTVVPLPDSPTSCEVANFNNLAYTGSSTNALLIDGNAVVAAGAGSGTIKWDPNADLVVDIYIFGSPTSTVTCSGGCDTPTGAYPKRYTCRCSDRLLSYTVAADATEIQVFGGEDGNRVVTYNY